jgi:NurA-like 5'-3' nuclease
MKKVISALLVASSFMLLTACDAGTAAQIGDTKISINTVQSRIAEINAERTKYDTSQMELSVGEELNRTEVRFLVISEIFKKLAYKSGTKITQAMKDAKKASILNSLGGSDQLGQALVSAQMAPSDFDLYIEAVLISDELSKKAISAGISEAEVGTAVQQLVKELTKTEKVKINPQYGTWDPNQADLAAFDSAGTAVKVKTA